MRIAALVVPLLALLTWASWPAPFPELDALDAEAIDLLRGLERNKRGAWAAIARARNPRTVPALMTRADTDFLDILLHRPEEIVADKRVIHDYPAVCCGGLWPHPAADAFERALQAAISEDFGCVASRDGRGCASCPPGALNRMLEDPEPGVRFAAATRLRVLGNVAALPRVEATLGDHAYARYSWLGELRP